MENTIYRLVDRATSALSSDDGFAAVGAVSFAHTKVKVRSMGAVLDTPSIRMPNGLSREQMRAFILSHAVKA
jgi:hypothetical protein